MLVDMNEWLRPLEAGAGPKSDQAWQRAVEKQKPVEVPPSDAVEPVNAASQRLTEDFGPPVVDEQVVVVEVNVDDAIDIC